MTTDLRIVPFRTEAREEVLDVINQAFEFPRSPDWFSWKHLDGPWGPSRGVVAVDAGGVVGVRLLLPWRLERSGMPLLAYRAVEASTLPRARGQGVFSRLNRALMEEVQREPGETIIFSTPNALSRDGYRKLGWTWLDPIPHRHRFAPVASRGVDRPLHGAQALDTYRPPSLDDACVATSWTPDALRWRVDPRSGNDYRAVASTDQGEPAGLIYRVLDRGRVRVLLELSSWGPAPQRRRVFAHAARSERATTVLAAAPSGVSVGRVALRRGGSLLAYWSPSEDLEQRWALATTETWCMTFSDLESVL